MSEEPKQEERRAELRRRFIEERGFWAPIWDDFLEFDPDFFEAYTEFSSVPSRHGALSPKTRELILIAVDVAATHLHANGARSHIRNAIKLGATREEIMEVFELVSVLGIHSTAMGAPMLRTALSSPAATDET
jgi:alkylhydroperoxidase/carboxymuconolactone decarboxylase family protein YurZ